MQKEEFDRVLKTIGATKAAFTIVAFIVLLLLANAAVLYYGGKINNQVTKSIHPLKVAPKLTIVPLEDE
jgi:hypothetical protein